MQLQPNAFSTPAPSPGVPYRLWPGPQLQEWSVTRVYDDLTDKLSLRPLVPLINTRLVGPNGEKDPLLTSS